MRTLIITLSLFLVLCVGMSINFVYINSVTQELTTLTEKLDVSSPSECNDTIKEIRDLWEKSIPLFSLSVSFREIDYLGETLLALSAACENRDEVEFERYRALLIDALDGVSRLEQFSIVNIF